MSVGSVVNKMIKDVLPNPLTPVCMLVGDSVVFCSSAPPSHPLSDDKALCENW